MVFKGVAYQSNLLKHYAQEMTVLRGVFFF